MLIFAAFVSRNNLCILLYIEKFLLSCYLFSILVKEIKAYDKDFKKSFIIILTELQF